MYIMYISLCMHIHTYKCMYICYINNISVLDPSGDSDDWMSWRINWGLSILGGQRIISGNCSVYSSFGIFAQLLEFLCMFARPNTRGSPVWCLRLFLHGSLLALEFCLVSSRLTKPYGIWYLLSFCGLV